MFRKIWWSLVDEQGLEHLHLQQDGKDVLIESLILRVQNGEPFHVDYKVRCDSEWRVKSRSICKAARNGRLN